MLATADLLAGEVLAVELFERQTERVHVQPSALRRCGRDDGDTGDELDLHETPPGPSAPDTSLAPTTLGRDVLDCRGPDWRCAAGGPAPGARPSTVVRGGRVRVRPVAVRLPRGPPRRPRRRPGDRGARRGMWHREGGRRARAQTSTGPRRRARP